MVMKVGDIVQYTGGFLRSIGDHSYRTASLTAVVMDASDPDVVVVRWANGITSAVRRGVVFVKGTYDPTT